MVQKGVEVKETLLRMCRSRLQGTGAKAKGQQSPQCDWKAGSLVECLGSENDKEPVGEAFRGRQEDKHLDQKTYIFISILCPLSPLPPPFLS